MKIKINEDVVAKGIIDFKKFKEILSENLDLEDAFYKSVKIEKCRIKNIDSVIRTLFLFTDWGNILILQKEKNLDVLELVIYECEVTDFTTYKFKLLDPNNKVMELETNGEDDKKQVYFMVFPTFNPTFEKHVEHMLSQSLIKWGEKPDWKYLVDLT